MKAYKKLMDIVAEFEKIVTSVILVFVTILTFVNVCVRYLSDSQFAWSEELTINLFVLLIMMGCGLQARDGSLISLSLVFDRLGVKGKKIFVAIITVVNCAFCAILLKTGIDKVMTQMANGKKTPSLLLPEWMFTIFLPIGAIFMILHTIEFCLDVMTNSAACVQIEE
ncbi:MAG: TRAP transporter small permease [Oscillibacter sp.]|nr:TRAP transporter small permease [Oscillibacter sp.]